MSTKRHKGNVAGYLKWRQANNTLKEMIQYYHCASVCDGTNDGTHDGRAILDLQNHQVYGKTSTSAFTTADRH